MNEIVFGFDLGKASLGYAARDEQDIMDIGALDIPAEHGYTADFRDRRRAKRNRDAHQQRELWLNKIWLSAGLEPLDKQDPRLTREFSKKVEHTIYHSASLRILLLQGITLEPWQIYKALFSAIQHRGYDANCKWDRHAYDSSDHADNTAANQKFEDDLNYYTLSNEKYHYPCYLEAALAGVWNPETPTLVQPYVSHHAEKVRTGGRAAPRHLVVKELTELFNQAQQQLPSLHAVDVAYFLYGEGKKPYASLKPPFEQHRGTEWDWQGVLGQKVPRFDNRIIAKCRLIPTKNVCKANDVLSIKFKWAMHLKNLRFTDSNGEHNRGLFRDEFKTAFELGWTLLQSKKDWNITYNQLVKIIQQSTQLTVYELSVQKEALKINTSGRSSFCRPALRFVLDIILSGQDPLTFDFSQVYAQYGLTHDEAMALVSRLGTTWETIHIGDNRYDVIDPATDVNAQIQAILGSTNNPVVRNRLQVFINTLNQLVKEHGVPDKVFLEFVRGDNGLNSPKAGQTWESMIGKNEKANDKLRADLEKLGLKPTKNNLIRLKLLREQQGLCPYTGDKLEEGQLSTYDIDHIVPASSTIATDSYTNVVLCKSEANRLKEDRTPNEWLKGTPEWIGFLERVKNNRGKEGYSLKKQQLLTRPDARELIENYNGLAETAYIARLTQQVVAARFGWPLGGKDHKQRVFVCDGKNTALIRRVYSLNELLLSDEDKAALNGAKDSAAERKHWKKNRENKKHHALDAYCITYSHTLKFNRVDDRGKVHWRSEALEITRPQLKGKLASIFPLPYSRNKKELYPKETFYGVRQRMGDNGKPEYCLTANQNLVSYLADQPEKKTLKRIESVFDPLLRDDLMSGFAEFESDAPGWKQHLEAYTHPTRVSRVKRVLTVFDGKVSKEPPHRDESGRWVFFEYKDFSKNPDCDYNQGQYKKTKQHKGQMVYFDAKGKPKVQPVYAHEKERHVRERLANRGVRLYQDGTLFYSGCLLYIPQEFKAGAHTLPAGLYKLNTMKSSGSVKIETENGSNYLSSIQYLTDAECEVITYDEVAARLSEQ